MGKHISIKAIKPFIIGKRVLTHDLPEFTELAGPELEYFKNCGIESIQDTGEQGGYDLARAAAEEVLAEGQVQAEELDAIIYIKSRIPDTFFISSDATRLQYELEAENALTFSISDLGCADSTMALRLARDFLAANRSARYVLICYGHKHYSPRRYRFPVTIQGDGGVAMLVAKEEAHRVLDMEIETNGKYWDLFQMPFRDRTFETYRETCSDVRKYGFELALESRNRFKSMNDKLLERQSMTMQEIDHFLLQNIAGGAYDYYQQAYGISISPVCKLNLARYGHLGCADVWINYASALESGLLQQGQRVLIMNNSPVAAWSSTLIEV